MPGKVLLALLHFIFWAVFTLLLTMAFDNVLALGISFLRALVNVALMAALFYLNLFFTDRYLERGRYAGFLTWALGGLVLFSALRVELNQLFPEIHLEGSTYSLVGTFWITSLATNLSVLLMSTFYQVLKNRYENERRNLAIINRQREAQLQFLKAQINPHFLFNTLNNIYSLAVMRSEKTAEMVLQLSNLLRYVIYESRDEAVPLQREVEQIERFIELYRLRCEHPPDIRFRRPAALDGHLIEPMVLIPLVENCFKHSDLEDNPKGFVHLELALEGDRMTFHTLNTKNPHDWQKDVHGGVGLENILRRLELKHPGAYALETRDLGNRFEVRLTLNLSHETHPSPAGGR